jgi:hypothetical protein
MNARDLLKSLSTLTTGSARDLLKAVDINQGSSVSHTVYAYQSSANSVSVSNVDLISSNEANLIEMDFNASLTESNTGNLTINNLTGDMK